MERYLALKTAVAMLGAFLVLLGFMAPTFTGIALNTVLSFVFFGFGVSVLFNLFVAFSIEYFSEQVESLKADRDRSLKRLSFLEREVSNMQSQEEEED